MYALPQDNNVGATAAVLGTASIALIAISGSTCHDRAVAVINTVPSAGCDSPTNGSTHRLSLWASRDALKRVGELWWPISRPNGLALCRRERDDNRAKFHAFVQIHHVFVGHADAAG